MQAHLPTAFVLLSALAAMPAQDALATHGTVVVTVRDHEGHPAGADARVQILERGPGDGTGWGLKVIETHFAQKAPEAGEASFAGVPLGKRVRVRVHFPDRSRPQAVQEIDGPTADKPERSLTVTLRAPYPVITGRLVRRDGTPVANKAVSAAFHGRLHGFDCAIHDEGRTDAAGRFAVRARFAGKVEAGPGAVEIAVGKLVRVGSYRLYTTHMPAGPRGRAPVANPLATGSHDVGDVRLAPVPQLVAGVIVDALGQPVPRLEPILEVWDTAKKRWIRRYDVRLRSGADGRFALREFPPPGRAKRGRKADRCRLRLEAPGWYLRKPIGFRRGDGEVRVELVRTGRIQGTLIVPPAFNGRLGFRAAGANLHAGSSKRDGDEIRFTISYAPPGAQTVEIRAGGTVCHRVPQVAVASGKSTELGRIDLREKLRKR